MNGGWVPGEDLVRRAVRAWLHDALAPAPVGEVLREGVKQLRDAAALLPDGIGFWASLWIDKLDVRVNEPAVAVEISDRALRLLAPLLRAAVVEGGGASAAPSPTMAGELAAELRAEDGA